MIKHGLMNNVTRLTGTRILSTISGPCWEDYVAMRNTTTNDFKEANSEYNAPFLRSVKASYMVVSA